MGFQAHSELPRRESNCILPLSFGLSSLQPQSTIYRSLHYWVEPVGCYKVPHIGKEHMCQYVPPTNPTVNLVRVALPAHGLPTRGRSMGHSQGGSEAKMHCQKQNEACGEWLKRFYGNPL